MCYHANMDNKSLTVQGVPIDLLRQTKAASASAGISMREWVVMALYNALPPQSRKGVAKP